MAKPNTPWMNSMRNASSQYQPDSRLIPGLADYMDGALPDDTEDAIGDGTNVSKEVDEDGKPIVEQNEVRNTEDTQPWYDKSGIPHLEVHEEPSGPEPYAPPTKAVGNGELPYCPVFVSAKQGGGRLFVAYINGSIEDVDNYLDLIDTLLTATEQDEYVIYEDSPGGYVASGGIIASAIHHSRAKVYTVARGLCASSAALIHSAAKPGQAIVSPFAVMMYHMSSHFAMGVSTQIAREAVDQVRYVNECLLNKAVADGHITQDEFAKIQNGEEIFIPAAEFIKRTTAPKEATNE